MFDNMYNKFQDLGWSAALEIRKLRKKLRQIENLERKDGDLLDEELLKVFIIHRHNVETISHRHVK